VKTESLSLPVPAVVRPRGLTVADVLCTGLAYLGIALWTVLGMTLVPLGLVLWKLCTDWSTGKIVRHFIWIYGRGWLVLMAPFVRFHFAGEAVLRNREPCVFVVNHLSFFDTYCMGLLPVFDIAFAVRAWPFRIPGYSWFMRKAEYLDVETLSWDETLARGRRCLEQDTHLLFFPEGHRSRDGRQGRFYSGAFRLAAELDCKVVPLCITGTDDLLPPGRLWLRPCRVTLRALPAVDPARFPGPDGPRRFARVGKDQIARALPNREP